MLATVLYEDSRSATRGFGLHALVVAVVADRLELPIGAVKDRLAGVPKKGNGNVRKAITHDAGRLRRRGGRLLAVVDDDKIRELVGLAHTACKRQVIDAVLVGCSIPDQVSVILLERNIESVIEAIAECGAGLSKATLDDALAKNMAARDSIFQTVAYHRTRDVHDRVLARVPALARLRDGLVALFPRAPADDTAPPESSHCSP